MCLLAQSCKYIQGWLGEDCEGIFEGWEAAEAICFGEGFEVKDVVSDCDCRTLFGWVVLGVYDTKGDIGEGEITAWGNG